MLVQKVENECNYSSRLLCVTLTSLWILTPLAISGVAVEILQICSVWLTPLSPTPHTLSRVDMESYFNMNRLKRKTIKVFFEDEQHLYFTHQSGALCRRQFCSLLGSYKQPGCETHCTLLTLYLSTIGNLTGPSLALFKFGKLSRCGMNGNPLWWKIKACTEITNKQVWH